MDIAAQFLETGKVTVSLEGSLPTSTTNAALVLTESRQQRRHSENLRYIVAEDPVDDGWVLDNVPVGSYECGLMLGGTVAVRSYVTVTAGENHVRVVLPPPPGP